MWTLLFCCVRKINSTWKIIYVFVMCTVFIDRIQLCVCDVPGGGAGGMDSNEPPTTAVVNVTYIDPVSGKLHTEKAEIGRYEASRIDNTNGLVVHVRSRNGSYCDVNTESDIPAESWIALMKDDIRCELFAKVEYSINSNASAIVVYKDRKETRKMMSVSKVKNLVAISINQEKGEEIAKIVDNGTRVYMYITVGYRQPKPNINRTSVLFVSVSFIVLMIISLAWLVFYYVQRFRYIHAKDQLARRLCNAAKKALAKIPEKNIKEMDGDQGCCAVCIEYYEPTDVVRTLPCKHVFHKKCVDPWLLEQRTCPMCKMDILEYYGLMFNSQESILHVDIEENVVSSIEENDSNEQPSAHQTTAASVSSNSYVEAYVDSNDLSDNDEEKSKHSLSSFNEHLEDGSKEQKSIKSQISRSTSQS